MSGEKLALWWADRYTCGLPDDARSDRLAELTSDLWEQRTAFGGELGTDLAIVSRCIRGMAADLSWRRSRREGRHAPMARAVARAGGWSTALLSYLFLVVTHGWGATALVGLELYGRDWEAGDVDVFAQISVAILAFLIVGAFLLSRLPRIGAVLLALGAFTTPIAFWWAAPMYVPMGVAVTSAGVVLARRSRARQLRARSATS
jgi:hypothetical protein